ncbi:MAG: GMC family oxidoreductase N-terminal domain-containing protein, partial [Alphaproteobacteria bacterium]|nr:GMC family oxidoreductase N-terminal domain-containing protein [Alphaproteobacteria bacterium]
MKADYIIVGGGSAGCVLAARLSEDPAVSVILLEAGGEDRNPLIHVPAGYIKTMVNPAMNWMFETEPHEASNNRRIKQPRGKVLGGSSSINAMLYVRGQAADYDGWAQRGNLGWSYRDVLPYFRRAEHCEFSSDDDEFHAKGGPLNVSGLRNGYEALDLLIEAAKSCGYPHNPDYNGASQDGFGYYQVTQKNGMR